MPEPAYAWAGDVATFVQTSDEDILGKLTRFTRETRGPQLFAWHGSIAVLRDGVQPLRADYWHYGEWYEEGPSHQRSACRLDTAVTEFGCQGLELDLPILCWGPDLTWAGTAWTPRAGRNRYVIDPARLRFNAYRVLLTRGRDGVCIFVPCEPVPEMDRIHRALLAAGAREFV